MGRDAHRYAIRGIPPEVDRVLRERAKRSRKSINQTVIEELTVSMLGRKKISDFSEFVGCWQPDTAFDEALEAQRRINPDDGR